MKSLSAIKSSNHHLAFLNFHEKPFITEYLLMKNSDKLYVMYGCFNVGEL